MRYFDAHAHIQFTGFDEDREELIGKLLEQEVGALVVGTDFESSKKAVELAERHPHLWASIGLHPNATEDEAFDLDAFRDLAQHPKVRAIGECGLDNFRPQNPEATRETQRDVFIKHVELALETDKPLMIHSRPTKGTSDAYQDLIGILTSYKKEYGEKLRGDIHFFVGGLEEARSLIELDFTLSFTAVLTFARDYDEVVRFAPRTHLLSETDSPYLAPASRRGQRNDPLSAIDVVEAIAHIRNEDPEAVREAILANATRLFRLS